MKRIPSGRAASLRGLEVWRHSNTALLLLTSLLLFFANVATAETTNALSEKEIEGRRLAQQLCNAQPAENLTNTGILHIRDGNGQRIRLDFQGQTTVADSKWWTSYRVTLNAGTNNERISIVKIGHATALANTYYLHEGFCGLALSNTNAAIPFAGSDFWLCDLGLEFFHWPQQKILKKEVRRSRGCSVLESTNLEPTTNGYSRVVSWIDSESGGIIHAEAYDGKNKLLKEFDPKSFKKVNGQWELQEMEIRNVQTGSRTRLEFDLKPK